MILLFCNTIRLRILINILDCRESLFVQSSCFKAQRLANCSNCEGSLLYNLKPAPTFGERIVNVAESVTTGRAIFLRSRNCVKNFLISSDWYAFPFSIAFRILISLSYFEKLRTNSSLWKYRRLPEFFSCSMVDVVGPKK